MQRDLGRLASALGRGAHGAPRASGAIKPCRAPTPRARRSADRARSAGSASSPKMGAPRVLRPRRDRPACALAPSTAPRGRGRGRVPARTTPSAESRAMTASSHFSTATRPRAAAAAAWRRAIDRVPPRSGRRAPRTASLDAAGRPPRARPAPRPRPLATPLDGGRAHCVSLEPPFFARRSLAVPHTRPARAVRRARVRRQRRA